MSGLPGGGLHDLNSVARHFFHEGRRNNQDTNVPLIFMGAVSVALGATMIYHGGKKLREARVKEGAAKSR